MTKSGRDVTQRLRGRQEPRLSHIPEGVEHPDLDAALELVRAAGVVLDPWQELVFRGACLRRDGVWSAKQVGICCPRQNGKNAILEARQLAGLFIFNERLQRYTAHLTDTAAVAFKRLAELVEGTPWLEAELKNVWRANGKEAIELKNGNTVQFRTRTDRAGRGPSPNTIYYDEAMELSEAAMAASIPSVAAKSMSAAPPQLWYTGSAVDKQRHPEGLVFARVRGQGLGGNHETAWFEWSVDHDYPEDVPRYDSPEQWAVANPGMNIRISEEHIAFEMSSPMGLRSFFVERLGVGDWPSLEEDAGVFDMIKWGDLEDAKSAFVGRPTICFDTSPNRTWSTICAAGLRTDGVGHVEITGRGRVVDRRRGTGWLVERLQELHASQSPLILCDERGPAQTLVPELEKLGVKVETVNAPEYAQACGLFFDAVEQGKVKHLGQPELTTALRAATTRPLGDRFAWDRKNSADDITPLVSATIAHWAAVTQSRPEPIAVWA